MPKYLISLCFLICLHPNALLTAAEITNYDEKEQTVIITQDGKQQEITLGSQQTVKEICNEGCSIKLLNGDEYNIAANDLIAIEGSMIFIDSTDTEQSNEDDNLYADETGVEQQDADQEQREEDEAGENTAPEDQENASPEDQDGRE